jgi:hypothetical protein
MANAFVKAQFMDPPGGPTSSAPLGAVKAGVGITITADGTISTTNTGGTVSDVVVSNGIQGGGQGPQVFLALLPPLGTALGGVRTLPGSGISIDADGIIRSVNQTIINSQVGIDVQNLGSGSYNLNLRAAGATTSLLGGVYVQAGSGLNLSPDGNLALFPPTQTAIGGVKAGSGVTIANDGTLNATGSGGTITGVGTGVGLGGGGTTGAVTLFQRPAGFGGATNIGGVYAGDNVTIDADGRISLAQGTGVATVTGTAPIQITGTATNPIIGVNAASITAPGIVQLSNSTSTTDSTLAATPTAVKSAYDLANAALSKGGGSMTGAITFTGGQTFPNTVNSGAFTQTGGILVGDTSPPGYAQLPVGSNGQILTANSAAPLGVEWQTSLSNPTLQTVTTNGATTNVTTTFRGSGGGETDKTVVLDGRTIKFFTDGTPDELILIDNMPGGSQQFRVGNNFAIFNGTGGTAPRIGNRIPATGTFSINGGTAVSLELDLSAKVVLDSTGFNVNTPFKASNINYPTADGTSGQVLVTNGAGNLSFSSSLLQKSGGTMTGDITFNSTQTFPGVVVSVGAGTGILAGGTATNPILSATTATTSALGVVQPDGTTITINGSGVISSTGGMSNPMTTLGDIIYASATGAPATPARLGLGAAGTILAVNGTSPAWRTTVQLGLLTATTAATTYAPINSPVFTGPAIVNAGGAPGSNAFTINNGSIVLATSFTPANSGDTGSTGEISWDNSYFYVCVAPNTWGRIAIDTTPF